ncbi:hypothetical protein C1645_828700 [Glomus cerebriforme]|uniref:K Homology domain-containing protein n=1 Tax=Glomus cerebriforme TaxID=658196 RepID=A0A397SL08_9GLOM|nr:hypothetical protein C1645_828700 [Glomus cerebriforme]
MLNIIEESYDISKSQRLSHIIGDKGNLKIKQFENQTGAKILVSEQTTSNITILKISGSPSQLREAKILIRDFLEKTSFIPTVYYHVLAKSGLNNDRKLKFVKFNDETVEINDNYGDDDDDLINGSNDRTYYFVEFIQQDNEFEEIDDTNNKSEDFLNLITPCHFNTIDKIDECLERLSLKIQTTFKMSSAFPEKITLKPKIFFGKVLFFDVINPKDSFIIQEWYRFNILANYESVKDCSCDNREIYNNKDINIKFQQDSPQIYDNLKLLEQKFGFKPIQGENKGSININYVPIEHKLRRLKLIWSENENKWKIVQNFHGLNRLANIDIISGSKVPDFRLSLKTHYDLSAEGSKVEEIINDIQFAQDFVEKDGMWFRSTDFVGTIIKRPVVRQVIEKKQFKNENFILTFKTIKEDKYNVITTEKLITLEHHTWNQVKSLDNIEEFMKSVDYTFQYIQKMLNALV